MTRTKIIFAAVIVASAVTASLLIRQRTEVALQEYNARLHQSDQQLVGLLSENQRLSNCVAQAALKIDAGMERGAGEEQAAELRQLRARVETLRQEADRLAEQVSENRRLAGARYYSRGDFDLLDHNNETAITFRGGPRATGKLNDARALSAALRQYADEHQGQFPIDLESLTPYLPKPLQPDSPGWANAPVSGTNDFEIVYQGSQNDLTNISPRRVALLRERQPWLTRDGKWARVYAYADGAASTVESDDDFRSWDAQHVIPPQRNP